MVRTTDPVVSVDEARASSKTGRRPMTLVSRWGETVRVDPGRHRVEATVAGAPFVRELELT